MPRPRARALALAVAVALAAAVGTACSDEAPAPSTTTADTLPTRGSSIPLPGLPGATTTTAPPAVVPTDVDACSLLKGLEVARVLGEEATEGVRLDRPRGAGDGSGPTTTTTTVLGPGLDDTADDPRLLLSTCAWPDAEDQRIRLTYVAPTVTGTALQHLQRLISLEGGFAGSARAVPLNAVDGIPPAALIGDGDRVLEVAAADGAALVYLEPPPGVIAGSPEAQVILDLTIAAIERAPR